MEKNEFKGYVYHTYQVCIRLCQDIQNYVSATELNLRKAANHEIMGDFTQPKI